jgi:hypothetical protein
MFLLGALLAGGVLGFTADRMMNRADANPIHPPSVKTMRENVAKRLDLTPAQRSAMDSILDDRHKQMVDLLKPMRPKMDSVKVNARTQIRRILTVPQQIEFDAIIKEMQADTNSRGDRQNDKQGDRR